MQEIDFELKRKNVSEIIADKIEKMILSDNTKVKHKLPSEQSLALSFGVSRPIIRESLVLLKARGLITPKNGEGSFICEPRVETITQALDRMIQFNRINPIDIFSVRLNLEVMSIKLATENIIPDEIDELRAINNQMKEYSTNIQKRAELDVFFHAKIAEISRNPILSMFVNSLATLLIPLIKKSLVLKGASEEGIKYHEIIIQTIKAGNPDDAAEIIRNHLTLSLRNFENTEEQEN